MNNDIKLILLDMDGTLLDSQGRISDRNKTALKAASDSGTGVTLVTGRMHRAMTWAAEELNISLPVTAYNGGLITEPYPPYKELMHNRIPDAKVRKIIELLRPFETHVNAYINDDLFVEEKSPEIVEYARVRDAQYAVVGSFEKIPSMDCTKLLVIEDRPEVMAEIKKVLTTEPGIEALFSFSNYCEIMLKGITKGVAVDFLADHMGIDSSQVMAMGDQENDLGMLGKAGIGVAMGNAREDIRESADWVTRSNNEDGVAAAVKHFFPELDF